MFSFGRIGQFLSRARCQLGWAAGVVVLVHFAVGAAAGQDPAVCDVVPAPAPPPTGLVDASYLAPLSEPLWDWEPLSELCPDSPFLWYEGSFWIEHIAGGGPGWAPYTGMGGSAPFSLANGVLLLEGQTLVTNTGQVAGSFGLHRRFFLYHQLFGAGLWYDVTRSPNENTFHQLSTSLEWFPADHWTLRINGYLPVGTRTEFLRTVPGAGGTTIDFSGNNLVASTHVETRFDDAAMRGYDIEAARNLGTWAGELFCGYYNYHGDIGGSTDGIKAGVRGYITPRLAGSITVSDDSDFATNVFGGLTWYFGGRGGKAPRSLCDKLTIPVERNPQIVINHATTRIFDNEVLNDAMTGMPITISHVRSQGGGSNLGTFENPFVGLPDTQTTDIIYVHGNSTFTNDAYIMNPGQSFLGEGDGNTHQVNTMQLGLVTLPAGSGGANRPVIQNTPLGIELADDATVSNIRITNAVTAIFADSVGGNVVIDRTILDDAGGAVVISDSPATFTFTDVTITDPTDVGLSVTGNATNINFGGGSSIEQTTTGGVAQFVGGHTGTVVFAADSTISATDGFGLGFSNADGQYTFNGTTTLSGGDASIGIISGSAGTFLFGADTSVTTDDAANSAFNVTTLSAGAQIDFLGSLIGATGGGDLISINTTAAGSVINFNSLAPNAISADGAGGIVIQQASGDINFLSPVDIRNPENSASPTGISIRGGSGNIAFADTSVFLPDGGFNAAVEIFDQSGSVAFNNLTLETNGAGTNGIIIVNANDVDLTGANTIDSTGGHAIAVLDVNSINMTFDTITVMDSQNGIAVGNGISLSGVGGGTFNVTGTTTIHGANGAPVMGLVSGAGIYIDDSSATFTFASVDIDVTAIDAVAIGTLSGNPGTVNINGGTIANAGGAGVSIENAGTVNLTGLSIDNTAADGVTVSGATAVNIDASSINDSGGNGVTVQNAIGFTLNDTIFTNQTGATISLTGSTVSGMDNIAPIFSSIDGGGNAGMIFFNGGADSAP